MIVTVEQGILLAHAAVTWFMVGLIWMVQVVHYPLFDRVGTGGFAEYEKAHARRITWIVAPMMCAEVGLAIAVTLASPGPLAALGLVALGAVWISTFGLQVPAHTRLSGGFDTRVHRMLVATNWLRTLAWSARGGIALAMLALGA